MNAQPMVYICIRATKPAPVPSERGHCGYCGHDVWMAKDCAKAVRDLAKELDARVACMVCLLEGRVSMTKHEAPQ